MTTPAKRRGAEGGRANESRRRFLKQAAAGAAGLLPLGVTDRSDRSVNTAEWDGDWDTFSEETLTLTKPGDAQWVAVALPAS